MEQKILTLLSDFGLSDVYVGVMKGVIAQVNPLIRVIDLTHQIPPQNIAAAQFNLLNAYPYFPAGTVHVAVVDPGVGGKRRAIALQLEDGFLVGPDNGLFTGFLTQRKILYAVELDQSEYWRSPNPSSTFHGRDIFASVGAYLANGIDIASIGTPIEPDSLVQSSLPLCVPTTQGWLGKVQYIDRFGNVITNIPGDRVQGHTWKVQLGKTQIPGCLTYGDVQPSQPLALIGSHGWVEIAVNNGDAQYQLRLHYGNPIQVTILQ
ncbi:MAG: S-adenosyl-l-methionine hydroxide adenosyltransferase family protein [Oculatellaceae cyanobacterium Prado106]|nr:S-adenosyl-l-methionine hydroxide adenosyltransferase family protein [Oculatellaceae cyanobacterium Prado106]